jgi:hypothetical protein
LGRRWNFGGLFKAFFHEKRKGVDGLANCVSLLHVDRAQEKRFGSAGCYEVYAIEALTRGKKTGVRETEEAVTSTTTKNIDHQLLYM